MINMNHPKPMFIDKETLMNYYIHSEPNGQLKFSDTPSKYLMLPSFLSGFNNETTSIAESLSERTLFLFHGSIEIEE